VRLACLSPGAVHHRREGWICHLDMRRLRTHHKQRLTGWLNKIFSRYKTKELFSEPLSPCPEKRAGHLWTDRRLLPYPCRDGDFRLLSQRLCNVPTLDSPRSQSALGLNPDFVWSVSYKLCLNIHDYKAFLTRRVCFPFVVVHLEQFFLIKAITCAGCHLLSFVLIGRKDICSPYRECCHLIDFAGIARC
jgi:hypothetical protein